MSALTKNGSRRAGAAGAIVFGGDIWSDSHSFLAQSIGNGRVGWSVDFPLRLEANGRWPVDVCRGLNMIKNRMDYPFLPIPEAYVVATPGHPTRAGNAQRALCVLLRQTWPLAGMFCREPYVRVVARDPSHAFAGTVQMHLWHSLTDATGSAARQYNLSQLFGLSPPFRARELVDA